MNIYEIRRKKLLDSIEDNSLVIIKSGQVMMYSLDEEVPFKTDPNFYYLTGIKGSNMIVLLSKINGEYTSRLYLKKIDSLSAKWVGATISFEEATKLSGITNLIDYDLFYQNIQTTYNQLRALDMSVYLDMYQYIPNQLKSFGHEFASYINEHYSSWKIKDVYSSMSRLRLVKDESEIKEIIKAINITNEGILTMMKQAKAGINEMELEAYFMLGLMKNGCKETAFKTIMAAGKNGSILHYVDNNAIVSDDSLVLCDLGATSNQYKADISRTYPVNGKFNKRQKELYELVLNGQKLVIASARIGKTLGELNQILIDYYTSELPKYGLLKPVSEYYYHGVSHMLGLDTHDIDYLRGKTKLEKGMVITVEPGLYIEDEEIGIRVEDNILIDDEPINLSSMIIKEIDDIEKWMAN